MFGCGPKYLSVVQHKMFKAIHNSLNVLEYLSYGNGLSICVGIV